MRIQYSGLEGCPGEQDFYHQVRARTPLARLAEAGQQGKVYAVRLRRADGQFHGRMEVGDPGGEMLSREMSAETCSEVVSALALVTALSIDPNASTGEVPAPPPPPPPKPRPRPAEASPPPKPPPPAPKKSSWAFQVGVGGIAMGAVSPTLALGPTAFVEASWVASPDWQPAVRLSALFVTSPRIDTGPGKAQYRLFAGRILGCPVAPKFDVWTWYGCAGVDAGAHHAKGEGVAAPKSSTAPWFAGVIENRLRWGGLEPVMLELQLGMIVPFRRDTFIFENPTTPSFEVPWGGVELGVGVGYHFL